ncbi:hypothetical protein BVRB_8g201990 [Beta vulgaris subsp. vulgaris]|uniref:Uncharacterized protein n=1 Tax=Beta vulgaris subsp. vulgaris TaxID=3555 RepID=A0A0J8B9A1_BETVV|nr:hypothetical protein BVRB_8g201990 [Beta vulgaris subsp. vulgaris]
MWLALRISSSCHILVAPKTALATSECSKINAVINLSNSITKTLSCNLAVPSKRLAERVRINLNQFT